MFFDIAERIGTFIGPRLTGAVLAAALLGVANPTLAHGLPNFADLVEEYSDAVVAISVKKGGERVAVSDLPEQLKRLMPDLPWASPEREKRLQREAQGSGFVIDSAGYIVTNHHVIADAAEISVIVPNLPEPLDASIVGTDERTDLALLKVEPDAPMEYLSLGDSDSIQVGDWVLAIGNPFGLGGSVSAGIVSARNRDARVGPYDDFIQTDAAVNRGNSGGPLINMDGEVVGVNTIIISPSGASSGIALAVPSKIVELIVDQLRTQGQVRRGWLGVRLLPVDPDIAEALGRDDTLGTVIAEVMPDTPAERAGLKAGDVIVHYDGQEVEETRQLPWLVAQTEIGKEVDVTVWRDGREVLLPVVIQELEEKGGQQASRETESPDTPLLGMILRELDDLARQRLSISEDVQGVLIERVEDDSVAASAGLERGNVILDVNQRPVATPQHVREAIDGAKESGRRSVLLRIRLQSGFRFVGLGLTG